LIQSEKAFIKTLQEKQSSIEANFVENLNNLMTQITGKAISTAEIPLENMY